MATLISERGAQAIWRDYLELTKPRVVVLMLIMLLVPAGLLKGDIIQVHV